VVNGNGEVVDADVLVGQLRVLKAAGVDGVMVDCWWGNVEAHRPQEYNWTGYKRLFHMIRELKLKLQVIPPLHIILSCMSPFVVNHVLVFMRISDFSTVLIQDLFIYPLQFYPFFHGVSFNFLSKYLLRWSCHSMSVEAMLEMMCLFLSHIG
jgi:hypothetical protein